MKKIVLLALLACSACGSHTTKGMDSEGKLAEMPKVIRHDNGDVTARFSSDSSPTLTKWWNGNIKVMCPAGHHFQTDGPSLRDSRYDEASCVPNPG